MNTVTNGLRRAAAWLAVWVLAGGMLAAQPPRRIHYQGRLTDAQNRPITVPTTVFFSLWRGGTAAAANSGTELYRESRTIAPDPNGIFDHDIGDTTTATVLLGSLTPALFETPEPLFVQVAVGTVGNVMLPRARLASVGYAFVASNAVGDITPRSVGIAGVGTVIDSAGRWVGGGVATALPGAPRVTALTDTTGGPIVVGDVLRLDGSFGTGATVLVGGRRAPIKSRSATQIQFQVPAGVPTGLNEVVVLADAAGVAAVSAGWIDVRRYLVWVAPGASASIVIVDPSQPAANQIVAQLNPGFTIATSNPPPLQLGFVNEGSAVIVPSNASGQVRAIDLTANPPSLIGSGPFNTQANFARAVVGSPDGQIAVVADAGISGLRIVRINEAFPPYTAGFFGTVSFVNLATGQNLTPNPGPVALPGFGGPRGMAFVNDTMLLVCGQTSNEIVALRRNPANNTFTFNPNGSLTVVPRVAVPGGPFAVRLMPDLTRVVVTTGSDLQTFSLAPEGFSLNSVAQTGAAGSLGVALAPDSKTGFVANPSVDRVHVYHWVGQTAMFAGDAIGPVPDPVPNYDFQLAAIEPGAGDLLAVGTTNSRLLLYRRYGATIVPLNLSAPLTLSTANRPTFALEFQP